MLSAVYEHLLPKERRALMPMLWSALKPGGTILINQTPCRWFPFEHHTTGLWGINYLPDFLACYVARHFSRESPETNRSLDWNGLLRHGVRGGTEREMLRNLCRGSDEKGMILQPTQGGFRDRAALWLSAASRRHAGVKKLIAGVFRASDRLTGMVPASHVEVAIQKPRSKSHTGASSPGELALRAYVGLLPKKPVGRLASVETYFNWQYQTSEKMFSTLPEFHFKNKRILEIGCGVGGRAAWLARNGAREVVGIDISFPDIRNAAQVKDKLYPALKNVSYYTCEEDEQLTDLGQFDIVLLLDSIEHVVSPLKVLRLAKKYAKPGGRVYFSTIGWFHHAGSHLGIPFATVFFSDETLLNFVRRQVSRPDYQPTDWDSDPPIAKWEGVYDLRDRPEEYLNKITIRQMKKLVRYAPYRRGRVITMGFRSAKVRWLNPLRHIPIVNEVFHSAVVGVLDA
jgi:2-polyprenyl-3-methyl-5-hydroxy-6-metoxy-1,4-benzoquinol methylase